MSDVVDQVVSALDARRSGHGWKARCPAHDDRRASLSIRQSDRGGILLYCHAGCAYPDITAAIEQRYGIHLNGAGAHNGNGQQTRAHGPGASGLDWLAAYCAVPVDFLSALPLTFRPGEVGFTFGDGLPVKWRPVSKKDFVWEPAGGVTPILWPLVSGALPAEVWLTEGETDGIVLLYLGFDAFALTKGAGGNLSPEQAVTLAHRGVRQANVVFDADKEGRKGGAALAETLARAGIEARGIDLADAGLVDPLAGQKDLRDAWRAHKDKAALPDGLRKAVETAPVVAVASTESGLPIIGEPVGRPDATGTGMGLRERNAAELRSEAANGGGPTLDYLPFLGLDGYIVRGWSHLLAGYPKAGKTELLTRLCGQWGDESVIYFTEEPESVWSARLALLPNGWQHVTLAFALGAQPDEILYRLQAGRESVVVIDTVRNLLGIRDETDNSEVARVLNPFVAASRDGGKTLVLSHHLRKGGGEHGEGITGGHAFLGVVDAALEVAFADGNAENRRRVRGWGRIISIPELIYERRDDKRFAPLGSPDEVALGEVKQRVLEAVTAEWQTRKDIQTALGEPKPSLEQVRQALNALVDDGQVERDPPEGGERKTHRFRLGNLVCQPVPPILADQIQATAA